MMAYGNLHGTVGCLNFGCTILYSMYEGDKWYIHGDNMIVNRDANLFESFFEGHQRPKVIYASMGNDIYLGTFE